MSAEDKDQSLRDHVVKLLRGGSAHVNFDQAIGKLPQELRGAKAPGLPHTVWQLLEHIRIAQWDILEFSRNKDHVSPSFPDGYWSDSASPPDVAAWDKSVETVHRDLKAMEDLVADPTTDLYAKMPWGDGQTILREALVLADHNGYHFGQIVSVRQVLGAW
ncbi:MAG TPA: DinB family protein [Thermoanaerobaculia bacterium]|nr:DinB family protein [Thermoanaerobaculia bacterium]